MTNPDLRNTPLDKVVSWLAFALLAAAAAAFAWYVPRDRDALRSIYRDFHLELPRSTRLICAVPTAAIVASAALAAVLGLFVQLRSDSKRSASLVHMLLTVAFGIAFLLYHEAMGSPFITLVRGISGAGIGR